MSSTAFSLGNIRKAKEEFTGAQVIPGLLKKQYGFLLGPPSKGKTYLLMSLAYEVVLGVPIIGLISKEHTPLRVLYVPAEDTTNGLLARASEHIDRFSEKQQAKLEQNLSLFTMEHPFISQYPDNKCEESTIKLIEEGKNFDLIIIDTIRKATGTAREVQEDLLYEALLDRLAKETDSAVLVSHHLRKNQSEASKGNAKEPVGSTGGSGLSSTQASSKYHLLLEVDEKANNSSSARLLSHTKDNYVPREYYIPPSNKKRFTLSEDGIFHCNSIDLNSIATGEYHHKNDIQIPVKMKPSLSPEQQKLIDQADEPPLQVEINREIPIISKPTLFGNIEDSDY